jgi:hypothetical protein
MSWPYKLNLFIDIRSRLGHGSNLRVLVLTSKLSKESFFINPKAPKRVKEKKHSGVCKQTPKTSFPGDHSRLAPPDPISNSEVKQTRADDSVGSPHVNVGHRQGFIRKAAMCRFFFIFFYRYRVC